MKNLLPLLFLVSCSSYEELQDSLDACQSDRNIMFSRMLEYRDNLNKCEYDLSYYKKLKPVLIELPKRPNLDLGTCIYQIGKTFCKETSDIKNWSDFDCIANSQTRVVYCPVNKCMVITSDGKECSL